MARPEQNWITFEIDGKQVRAPEGAMLVDAAKHGDVEIPYFCYEPKLGQPVGACRMCLVEIEGIPKLQTSCSTPVRDGMVVVTTSDRVKHAQNAVVEFLLVNHPLDCPVCDKGGECPLQDISFGWGAGRSRYIEPKRHFKKPLELSPLVAIDRERCILCYRCVRFSQEVAEDHQLVFLERGDHTFVGTHDGRPYVAPFSGNIIELCPVGALTSTRLSLPRAAVGHRGLRDDLHALPVAVQREADDPRRREGRARARARQRGGGRRLALRQGPLRLPVLRRARAHHRAADADRRLPARDELGARAHRGRRAARALRREHGRARGWPGHQRGGLPDAAPAAQGARLAARDVGPGRAGRGAALARALARVDLSARVSDIDHADAILVLDTELVDEAPILDLRVRKAVRRNGARLVVASSRPSTLDPGRPGRAALRAGRGRGRPGGARGGAGLAARERSVARRAGGRAGATRVHPGPPAARGRRASAAARGVADVLRDAGDVVVIFGERVFGGERGAAAGEALLAVADALGIAGKAESGLIAIPAETNGRGLREVGCSPGSSPGWPTPPRRATPTPPAARCCCSRPTPRSPSWPAPLP